MRRLLALLVVATAAFVPAGASADAWKTHRNAAGFSVAAPAGWVDFTRSTPQVLDAVATIPSLSAYVDVVRRTKAVKLMLVNVGPEAARYGFATNLNVTQAPAVGDLELQRRANTAQLKALGVLAGPLRTGYVALPAGRALTLTYRARMGAGTPTVAVTQYFLLRAGRGTVLTYTTLPVLEGGYKAAFRRSARSFRFLS